MKRKSKIVGLIIFIVIIFGTLIFINALDGLDNNSSFRFKRLDLNSRIFIKEKQWGLNGDHYVIAFSLDSTEQFEEGKDLIINQNFYYKEYNRGVTVYLDYRDGRDTIFFLNDLKIELKNTQWNISYDSLKSVDEYHIE